MSDEPQPQQAPPRHAQQAAQRPQEGAGPGPAVGIGSERDAPPATVAQMPPEVAQLPPAEPHSVSGQVHRGDDREQPRPSGDAPTEEMACLGLEASYRHRQPTEEYLDVPYKEGGKSSQGTEGKSISLLTNYFVLTLPSEIKIWKYHVNFTPEVANIHVKYALIVELELIKMEGKSFNGDTLYLCRLLPDEVTECSGTRIRKQGNITINIKIKRIGEVSPNTPEFLQIVKVLLKKVMVALGMTWFHDHYCDLSQHVQMENKLVVMPGFSTSIIQCESAILMAVDFVKMTLRTDIVLDCLDNLLCTVGQEHVQSNRDAAINKLVDKIVWTRHENKTYRVIDIFWHGSPSSTFKKRGVYFTYIDYIKQRWNIDILYVSQPLLLVKQREGKRQQRILMPELCTITDVLETAKSNFNLNTQVDPDPRLHRIKDFLSTINANPKFKELFQPWQMKFHCEPLCIPARQLPPEEVTLRNPMEELTTISYKMNDANWSQNMKGYRLLKAMNINQWLLIYPQMLSGPANDLADYLIRIGDGMGMTIAKPTRIELLNDQLELYSQAIQENLKQNVQIVLAVTQDKNRHRYDAIKASCSIENRVPSQLVLLSTLTNTQELTNIATKIAIQMNCKMGGVAWRVNIPFEHLMVIGMDSHPNSANEGQSVGALVASLNKKCTRYYSGTEIHPRGNDALDGITTLLEGALKKYRDINHDLPQTIIIYRNGVSDGKLEFVYEHESAQVVAAFSAVSGDSYKPRWGYITVQKSNNTRLFSLAGPNQVNNPMPGTIVDSHITKPDWYDFFLVSQSGSQGTVSPTSYRVMYNNPKLTVDDIQSLTFKLTHLYVSWQGTIRVPAPCKYAEKIARLQGQSLHQEFSPLLADKLFYL